jgi:hypothetical protein
LSQPETSTRYKLVTEIRADRLIHNLRPAVVQAGGQQFFIGRSRKTETLAVNG